jgi:anti-sigma regulatory factor (Ser/Thr protein kinase)
MAADEPVRSLPLAMFGPEVTSVTLARHRMVEFLYDVPEDVRMVAALLVSEITTNAVRHAGTHFSLGANVTPFGLRVEVADESPQPPVIRDAGPSDMSGRGMMLVSQLADNWGTERIPAGKLVWFELSLAHPE